MTIARNLSGEGNRTNRTMMTDRDDDPIRERAYAIWQAEGCPDDRHQQHWRQAAEEIARASVGQGDAASSAVGSAISPSAGATAPVPAAIKRPRKTAREGSAKPRPKKVT